MKRRKRVVAFVVPVFPRLAETFIVSKLLRLLDLGWDVHVVCERHERHDWGLLSDLRDRPHLRRRVHPSWPHRPRVLAMALLPLALVRCLVAAPAKTLRYLLVGGRRLGAGVLRRLYLDAELLVLKPSLIHFEFGSLAAGRSDLGELLGARLVASFRGFDLNRVGLGSSGHYAEVWAKAEALHFLSEALWRSAREQGCPPQKRHALIPPAIDARVFDPGDRLHHAIAGTEERPLRILSVGRLTWEKGHEYALQAVRLLLDRGVSCEHRVIGDGEFLEGVSFARHQMGLEGCVQLLGARGREEVQAQMLWADVLLHAAVSEGFSNAVLEAQAMKLPVVASDAGGLPENVTDGETGRVVPRRDPAALARELERLAVAPDLRQRMGETGRQRVLEHFRPEDQALAFERLYREVLAP